MYKFVKKTSVNVLCSFERDQPLYTPTTVPSVCCYNWTDIVNNIVYEYHYNQKSIKTYIYMSMTMASSYY